MKRVKDKTVGFLNEFKQFALRGNVVDLAVGVIIGGAFGKITASLVADIVMPLIGVLLGGVEFAKLSISFPSIWEGKEPVQIMYGQFIQVTVDFIIIAFSVFIMVKAINKLKRKEPPPAVEEPPEPTTQELLLAEIRDLLKENAKHKK